MLSALKMFLRSMMAPTLYVGAIIVVLITIFRKAELGFYLMTSLIPQPNIWYKLHDYPFGKDFMDILFFSVLLGMILQSKKISKTGNGLLILVFIIVNYLAVVNSSLRFSLPFPVSATNSLMPEWKNYIEMMLLYFLALNVIKDEDRQKTLLIIMSVVILFIAVRSYRNFSAASSFSYDKRVGGPFEAVGLGANHYGAFVVDYIAVLLGLFFFDKNRWRRLLYLATVLFSLHPLFYSYSRGAYLAAFAVLAFVGVTKKRSMLVLTVVIVIAWQTILPASVVDRIQMTETPEGEIEHSAGGRLALWDHAMELFRSSPVFGIGYGGYALSSGGVAIDNGEILPENQDAHNFYMRTLSEQGIIGIAFLLFVLYRAFMSGYRLYKAAPGPLQKGLGFGFMSCVFAVAISNMFGDRWSYFVLGSYFWILWGMIDRGILNAEKEKKELAAGQAAA